jgi:hypothetical protein
LVFSLQGSFFMNSTDMPRPKPGVMDIAAYVPGRETAHGAAKVYKLSSNESPLGPSPKVAEALAARNANLALYPDGSAHLLRDAISRTYGLNPGNIMCGNGSDELLGLLCQTYLAPGDEGVFTEHGFLVYKIQIMAAGATPVSVPDTDDLTANVDNILGAVTERTKLVFLANPEQSHRDLSSGQRSPAPACGPARSRDPCARRGLCRVCPAQRLRGGHRAGFGQCQCGDDPDVLEDPRTCGPQDWLDVCARGDHRRLQPGARAVSTSTPWQSQPARLQSGTGRISTGPSSTMKSGWAALSRQSRRWVCR